MNRIFLTKDLNKYEIYCVALFVNGVWEPFVLDGKFPVVKGGTMEEVGEYDTWAFAQSKTHRTWFMLLEKAFSKMHGGY